MDFVLTREPVGPTVFAEGPAGNPIQSDRPFSGDWALDRWPDVPTQVLTGGDDQFFPPSFQSAWRPSVSCWHRR
jgi:hypothetical protein